jgi:Rad3-related DNA helicase/serine/threonine protein kinase
MAEVELQQIGSYLITGLLYESSTGIFYAGKQRKKELLIKRLRQPFTTNESKEAFLTRARQLKKLKDRMIINTLDAQFEGDYGYLIMEYVEGETWRQHITPGQQLAPDEVKRVLSPVAGALHYAHVSQLIHGNLHPGALILITRNNTMLTEFALPGVADDPQAIPYMAPEHLQGQPVFASDQYALAVMAYEWLCGRRPYEATERNALLHQQEHEDFPSPRSLNDAISPAVEQVILQALARKPEDRFPHTRAFADHYLSALMGFTVKSVAPKSNTAKSANGQSLSVPSSPLSHPTPPSTGAVPTTPAIETVSQHTTLKDTAPETPLPISLPQTNGHKPAVQESSEEDIAEKPARNGSTPRNKLVAEKPDKPARASEQLDDYEPLFPTGSVTGGSISRLQSVVNNDLGQGGVLSQSLPGYEERPSQIEMANVVARSLRENVPAIVEASTGTGKSLAYLVPVVRSGKVAIVSTANKALQEQLFYKDIPFIQQHIKDFEAALVKGVNNYICLERLETERTGMQFFTKNRDFKHLLDIINDPDSTFMGDFETLGFQLPGDIRGRIATDSDQCAWSKCGYFMDCYVRFMRERAQRAQVIVVNHTLLLLDAAMDGFLLPERDVIVLDEAHHLEEEATRSFTITVNPMQIQTLLAQRMLKDHTLMSLQDETMRKAQEAWARLEQVANPGLRGRANLEAPLEEGLRLASVVSDLADSLRKQRPKDLPEKEGQLYDKLLKRTQNLSESLRTVFSLADTQKFVYYVDRTESSRGGVTLQASAAPLDVTSWLKQRLFDKCNVICTSATLATVGPNPTKPEDKGPNFAYFRRRIGLDPIERSNVLERILPLAFDYENNALLYLPRDLPAPAYGPGSDEYMKAIAREMYKLVKLSRGRAFLLFSSKRMLDRAYELMSPHLDYPLLKQGDMTRIELTRRFREEEGAVLFGLKSFWEGVDIAGDALSLVVIDKLPFDPPDDPVHEARVAHMKAAGENWFGTYVLPQAVLRLKQGIGRLLRTREDRGVMAILDTRLHTKGYGRQVLNALPPARRTSSLRDVDRFFKEELALLDSDD